MSNLISRLCSPLYFPLIALLLLASENGVDSQSQESMCELYPQADFEGEPLAALKDSGIIYDLSLIINDPDGVKSLKLGNSCGIFTCTEAKFKGACDENLSSIGNFTNSLKVKSAICRCSSPIKTPSHSHCAALYSGWKYSQASQNAVFPGTVAILDPHKEILSVAVKPNCTLSLWKLATSSNQQHSLDLEDSMSYFKWNSSDPYNWFCCHCDDASKSVCENAKNSGSETVETNSDLDFENFTQYTKKIIGIGRNYRWKKSELTKVLEIPKEPIVFLKPSTSFIQEGQKIKLPTSLGTIFYELELGVVIGKTGKNVPVATALDHVSGYFLALDMTAKEFLKTSIASNRPWEIGKGFDTACPVGHFIPKSLIPNPNDVHLTCKVNGNVVQSDNTDGMIFNVPTLISYISKYMTLEPYDVILTGTPDGLGPLSPLDVIEGQLGNITTIRFDVIADT